MHAQDPCPRRRRRCCSHEAAVHERDAGAGPVAQEDDEQLPAAQRRRPVHPRGGHVAQLQQQQQQRARLGRARRRAPPQQRHGVVTVPQPLASKAIAIAGIVKVKSPARLLQRGQPVDVRPQRDDLCLCPLGAHHRRRRRGACCPPAGRPQHRCRAHALPTRGPNPVTGEQARGNGRRLRDQVTQALVCAAPRPNRSPPPRRPPPAPSHRHVEQLAA